MLKLSAHFLCVYLAAAMSAWALGPHEIALVVNAASANSRRIADLYAELRNVPKENIVAVDLPTSALSGRNISPEHFRDLIFGPVQAALVERGVSDHVYAWVYSVDFPVRVSTVPPTSLTGMTFVKGEPQPADIVETGVFSSPVYAGPGRRVGRAHYSQSFDMMAGWLGDDMPISSMMLGVTGERGNSLEEIEACLRRGAASDGQVPEGEIVFVDHGDIRSRCRQWQFAGAVEELRTMHVEATILNALPAHGLPLTGLMAGEPTPQPQSCGPYRPGCIAEHLTSLGAVFETDNQTKLTEWIRAGATVSCGTITEPMSLWMKFPTARVYVHQAAGCTAIESMYQAIRCPLQLLIVGEPLAAPWAHIDAEMRLRGTSTGTVSGPLRLEPRITGDDAPQFREFMHLLDGRIVGRKRILWINADDLPAGKHQVRSVAYSTGFVRHQIFDETTITVDREEP